MLVPFMSWQLRKVNLGTDVIAPPGAHTVTPYSPSIVGPLDVQVYGIPWSFCRREYSATIMSGDTYAPTPATNHEEIAITSVIRRDIGFYIK